MAVVKRLTQWVPRPGVERDEAIRRWRTSHVALVRKVPGVQRYVQNVCAPGPDGSEPLYAGLGELSFETLEDAQAALSSAEWKAVVEDAGEFMDLERATVAWADEHSGPRADAAEPAEARALVEGYLARRRANRTPAPAPFVRRVGRRVVPQRFRLQTRLAATVAASPRARRSAETIATDDPLRLHLGSGPARKDGWVNVDLVGDDVDLTWNILKPLPFTDGSVDAIFHEHVLEHLSIEDGYQLARESHRLLRPGGVLRIGVPDCGTPDVGWPDAPTRLLALHEFFAEPGHQTMYDAETLGLLLRAAGFDTVEQRSFGESRIEPAPDSEHRRVGSLYVEAVK